jgi:hypothetical protein
MGILSIKRAYLGDFAISAGEPQLLFFFHVALPLAKSTEEAPTHSILDKYQILLLFAGMFCFS